ncbi:DUF7344 domain-containing protein [Haloterrigena salifodinae]
MRRRDRLDARDRDIRHRIPADSSRRAAIAILDRGAIGLDDLTRDVATFEAIEPADDAIEWVVLSFRHVHLVILEDACIVRYLSKTGRVALLENERRTVSERSSPSPLVRSSRDDRHRSSTWSDIARRAIGPGD